MISYTTSAQAVQPEQLQGFFRHWMHRPTPETLTRILRGSDHVVLATDSETGQVVGYITAISDGISCAYIPHLEVLEARRGQGIGTELVRRMLEQLRELYMIDLMCDADVQPFYARLGFQPAGGMVIRDTPTGEPAGFLVHPTLPPPAVLRGCPQAFNLSACPAARRR